MKLKIKNSKIRNRNIIKQNCTFWANFPNKYKLATTLHDFKLKRKDWHCDKCVYMLCQNF